MASSRNWRDYNEALVKRGLILLDLDFMADWSRELKVMNQHKEGARYRYPESFIKLLAMVHAYVLPSIDRFHRGSSDQAIVRFGAEPYHPVVDERNWIIFYMFFKN